MIVRGALGLIGACAAAIAVGGVLGWLSRGFYVIGLLPIALGLAAGATVTLAALAGGPRGPRALGVAGLAIVCGWLAFSWVEDHHFQEVWRDDLTRARLADAGAPADAFDPDTVRDEVAGDADALLASQVEADVGMGGPVGRWLFRARSGVRLVGAWTSSRGLAVGIGGAVVWATLELLIAFALALTVLRRGRSADEEDQLEQERDEEDRRAAQADDTGLT